MLTRSTGVVRPTRLGFALGWLLMLICVASIAGTVAELAKLPAVLLPGAPAADTSQRRSTGA